MRISIADKKTATKNMILDIFNSRVEKWENKVQKQLSELYLAEFPKEIEWYDDTPDDLQKLIKTRNKVYIGMHDQDVDYLFHPKIVVYIGEKPERYWDKQNPVCIPFGEYKRSRSTYEFEQITIVRNVPKFTSDYYYAKSGKLKTTVKKLIKEKRELEQLIETAGNQFYSALLTINTDKKLQELLPDAVKYIPTKEPKSLCKDIVPTELYTSVTALINGG